MIGAAIGGLLVHPAHNLHYVENTYFWAGVMPMALMGIARAFETDFAPYLTARGLRLYRDMQATSIVNVVGQPAYWRLKWSDLVIPAYPNPESLPLFVSLANKLIMGTGGTPTVPLFIGQGANGDLEWTPGNKPGIGAGDGVMITGDVRTLARTYCAQGTAVHYEQYDLLSHITSVGIWLLNAIGWINDRFAGQPAPQNCSSIPPGNPLDPIPVPWPLRKAGEHRHSRVRRFWRSIRRSAGAVRGRDVRAPVSGIDPEDPPPPSDNWRLVRDREGIVARSRAIRSIAPCGSAVRRARVVDLPVLDAVDHARPQTLGRGRPV